jgi:hypothetical protein
MTKKVTDINKKQEDRLFDKHMETMFDLVDELLDRDNGVDDNLTEGEEAFLDAFFEYNEFVTREEE